jgi:hypothetical protein
MVSPVQAQNRITEKIVDHYAFQAEDFQALRSQLERQLTVVYRQTISAQLNLYGCQKLATGPDAISMRWISEKAETDATSIAATYLRELANKVTALNKSNRRGNRYFYMSALDAWLASRTPRKSASIGLNTMTAAREYAKDRFITENGIEGKFVLVGPPPVCKDCIRIKGYGPMTYKQTRMKNRRLPAHAGCPHTYQALTLTKLDCSTVWTG